MKTIAIMSQKGGSGKTTLAVHLAVVAAEDGERVVIVDTDPQKSAGAWYETRTRETPVVVCVAASMAHEVLKAARHDGMTLAVVDTAPHAAPDAVAMVELADFILVPCRPFAFDLAAVDSTLRIIHAAGKPGAIVLNACPVRAPEILEAQEALSGSWMACSPVLIGDRRAFARAVASGKAVTEFDDGGRAAEEIRKLWKWLKKEVPR
jgi:chromosome partitioning protein